MVTNTSPWPAVQTGGGGNNASWFNRSNQQISPTFIQSPNVSIWFDFKLIFTCVKQKTNQRKTLLFYFLFFTYLYEKRMVNGSYMLNGRKIYDTIIKKSNSDTDSSVCINLAIIIMLNDETKWFGNKMRFMYGKCHIWTSFDALFLSTNVILLF